VKTPLEKRILNSLKKPKTLEELVENLNSEPKRILDEIKKLRRAGYEIVREDDYYYFNGKKSEYSQTNVTPINVGKEFKLAFIGDTHIGSKYARLDFLHKFYDVAKLEGVQYVIHAGDVIDGVGVYPTQTSQLSKFTIDDQVEEVINFYPNDINTFFICGNHCLKQYQRGLSIHPGKVISQQRKDMKWIGDFYARLRLGRSNVYIDVVHPTGQPAYAISYKLQKYIEKLPSGNKPNILLWGHFHTAMYMSYRNIHAFQVGCFQDANDLTARMGIYPVIGGWIIEGKHNGYEITKLKMWFKEFYR